jgi:hypothetical protein
VLLLQVDAERAYHQNAADILNKLHDEVHSFHIKMRFISSVFIAHLQCLKPEYSIDYCAHLCRCFMLNTIMTQQTTVLNSHQYLNLKQLQCMYVQRVAHLKIQYCVNLVNLWGMVKRCILLGRYVCFWYCYVVIFIFIFHVELLCCKFCWTRNKNDLHWS